MYMYDMRCCFYAFYIIIYSIYIYQWLHILGNIFIHLDSFLFGFKTSMVNSFLSNTGTRCLPVGVHSNRPCPSVSPLVRQSLNISETAH